MAHDKFSPGDLVRVSVPVGTTDHNGSLRTWKPTAIFRVLHVAADGDVVVSEDSRGLRTTLPAGRLVMHKRAEQAQTQGA